MPLKLALAIGYVILVVFLFLDHARTHEGKFFTVDDFTNTLFSMIKSHEGLIIVATIFYIGCIIGMLITLTHVRVQS